MEYKHVELRKILDKTLKNNMDKIIYTDMLSLDLYKSLKGLKNEGLFTVIAQTIRETMDDREIEYLVASLARLTDKTTQV